MARRLRARARAGRGARQARAGRCGQVADAARVEQLVGPTPHDDEGGRLAPQDAWGHDHLWWLDRMVRTQAPLVERMTLVWHDWFATSKAGVPQKLMLRQNALLRRHALGNFEQLALDITRDPAMLLWLNGTSNNRWDAERELRPRAAGAVLPRRRPRLHRGRRARAGAGADRLPQRLERRRPDPLPLRQEGCHDTGPSASTASAANYGWQEGVRLVTRHRRHPEFLVTKLWGYFIPTKPPAAPSRHWRACT